jgi:hypothetical protein
MNKIIKNTVLWVLIFPVVSLTNTVSAESFEDKKENCVLPRFRKIQPPPKSELPPKSEFSFTLPEWTNPNKVTVTVKRLDAVAIVEDHNSFYLVKVTLPAELRDTYARVRVKAAAKLGCHTNKGWLYKISAGESGSVQEESQDDQQPSTEKEEKPEIQ